jgi:toxin ParE1/3/4
MILPVTQRPRARLDLLEQFIYFSERDSENLAERYLAAVEATCLQLVDHPHSGVLYHSGIAGLKGLRRLPVKGFENYLLFYLPHRNGIDVIRVLHGARDIDSLFAQEET